MALSIVEITRTRSVVTMFITLDNDYLTGGYDFRPEFYLSTTNRVTVENYGGITAEYDEITHKLLISRGGAEVANHTDLSAITLMGHLWHYPTLTTPINDSPTASLQIPVTPTTWGSDAYNIKTYGAIGDGLTDDTAAIQATVNAAALDSGQVYVPKGTFLTTGIDVPSNVTIYGIGEQRSILLAGGNGEIATGTAQSGTLSTIILENSASAVNNFYNHQICYIVSGAGAGQYRWIGDYVGATKTATLSTNWTTIPDATSVYSIRRALIQPNTVASADYTRTFFINIRNLGITAYTAGVGDFMCAINLTHGSWCNVEFCRITGDDVSRKGYGIAVRGVSYDNLIANNIILRFGKCVYLNATVGSVDEPNGNKIENNFYWYSRTGLEIDVRGGTVNKVYGGYGEGCNIAYLIKRFGTLLSNINMEGNSGGNIEQTPPITTTAGTTTYTATSVTDSSLPTLTRVQIGWLAASGSNIGVVTGVSDIATGKVDVNYWAPVQPTDGVACTFVAHQPIVTTAATTTYSTTEPYTITDSTECNMGSMGDGWIAISSLGRIGIVKEVDDANNIVKVDRWYPATPTPFTPDDGESCTFVKATGIVLTSSSNSVLGHVQSSNYYSRDHHFVDPLPRSLVLGTFENSANVIPTIHSDSTTLEVSRNYSDGDVDNRPLLLLTDYGTGVNVTADNKPRGLEINLGSDITTKMHADSKFIICHNDYDPKLTIDRDGNVVTTGSITSAGGVKDPLFTGIKNALAIPVYAGHNLVTCNSITLSRGTSPTKVASTTFDFVLNGIVYHRNAIPAGSFLAAGTIPINQWGCFLYVTRGPGTFNDVIALASAANFTTGYNTEADAIAALRAEYLPGTISVSMGYVTIKTAVGFTFRVFTDALEGGVGGNPSSDTNFYDMAGNVSGSMVAVTDISGTVAGDKFSVLVDPNTTLDLSGTNLVGNGGVDWTPTVTSLVNVVSTGTTKYCQV